MAHRTATERAIADMHNVIVRHKKGIIADDVHKEARIQAKNMISVVVQL